MMLKYIGCLFCMWFLLMNPVIAQYCVYITNKPSEATHVVKYVDHMRDSHVLINIVSHRHYFRNIRNSVLFTNRRRDADMIWYITSNCTGDCVRVYIAHPIKRNVPPRDVYQYHRAFTLTY